MTDKRISELDAITGSNTAATDVFVVVDTSTGQTKKITREELNNAIERDVLDSIDIDTIQGDFAVNGSMTITGTVDGRDVAADGTKLDGIEASATADQTASEIKTAYESNADTNEFSDAEQAKLAGVEANATADQTASEIKTAYESNADTNEFSDAEKTKLAGIEANATADQTASEIKTAYESNADTNEFSDAEQTKLAGIEANATADQTASEIKTAYESNADTNEFSDAEQTKLAGIEASADVTDTANVTAAGAAMLTGATFTGNVKLDADNAGIQLKSGITGTEGLIKWTFDTDNTVYAKAGITFDTRATDGFLLDVGYPITLDATTDIKFKIVGSEEMRLEADGDLHVDGNVIAYSTTISDKRLKKDIAPIDNALWKVSQLNGCTFTYLKDDRKSAGLIAQDLEKVLPSAVIEDEAVFHGEEGKTYKTVQYDQVIGLLVEAVKELTAKVEELENASTK